MPHRNVKKNTQVTPDKIMASGFYVNGKGADAGGSPPVATTSGAGVYVNGKGFDPSQVEDDNSQSR